MKIKTTLDYLQKPNPFIAANILPDVICFSHLRWDFVYQRPQHLMSRFGHYGKVYFFEEPLFYEGKTYLSITQHSGNIYVCVPYISHNESANAITIQKEMVEKTLTGNAIDEYIFWYYTPMAIEFSDHFKPQATVYDCMDELTAFKFAPPKLKLFEQLLLAKADLVFTGGESLYQAKKNLHPKVFAFPSSIDLQHFEKARNLAGEPACQAVVPSPKLGFFGVIDERIDTRLLAEMADLRPEWQFVMIGPIVKILPDDLPSRPNIHYLGKKAYDELPAYLSAWDIALMPFAMNESTRFISPTKTPEYLAAGKPVISTPVRDVVNPYGLKKLVHIAATGQEFIDKAEIILKQENVDQWLKQVDNFLLQNSWDDTFNVMCSLIVESYKANTKTEAKGTKARETLRRKNLPLRVIETDEGSGPIN